GNVAEHVLEVSGHCYAADRPGKLALLDPEPRGTAAIVAGDAVHTEADQVVDIEAALDAADQRLHRFLTLLKIKITGGRPSGPGIVARGFEAKLARRIQVEQPGGELAVLDQVHAPGGQTFSVERA